MGKSEIKIGLLVAAACFPNLCFGRENGVVESWTASVYPIPIITSSPYLNFNQRVFKDFRLNETIILNKIFHESDEWNREVRDYQYVYGNSFSGSYYLSKVIPIYVGVAYGYSKAPLEFLSDSLKSMKATMNYHSVGLVFGMDGNIKRFYCNLGGGIYHVLSATTELDQSQEVKLSEGQLNKSAKDNLSGMANDAGELLDYLSISVYPFIGLDIDFTVGIQF